MKEERNAFFYQNEYYLFPKGVESVDELSALGEVEVVHLLRTNCKPPDFKYGETEKAVVCISAPAYFTKINLWTDEEYEEVFGKISKTRCRSCKKHTSGDCENGRKNLSLNGVCYSYHKDGEEKVFGDGIRDFLCSLAEKAEEVKILIDQDDQKTLGTLLDSLLNEFFVPMYTHGGMKEDGAYALCFSAKEYGIEGITVSLLAIVKAANAPDSPLKQTGLFLFPFLPRGIYKPTLSPNYFQKPPRIFYGYDEETGECEIFVYEKKAEEWSDALAKKRSKNAYRYLCSILGEDLLYAVATRVQIVSEIPLDKEQVNETELLDRLRQAAEQTYAEEYFPFPAPFVLEPTVTPKRTTPYKEAFKVWITACPELAPSLSPVGEENQELFEAAFRGAAIYGMLSSMGIKYAYVYLPNGGKLEDENRYIFEDCLENLLRERALRGATVCVPVGVVGTDEGICLDFLVFDENEFFDLLQKLAPVLTNMRAKIVTVAGTESMVYDGGFEITPEDSEFLS